MNNLFRQTTILVVFILVFSPLSSVWAATYQTSTFLSKVDSGTGQEATQAYVDEPMGFELTSREDIYLVDSSNNVVERINQKNDRLTRVAGTTEYGYVDGSTANAQFAKPEDLAVYGQGKQIFVADTGNNVIRKIANGQVSTFLTDLKSPKGVYLYGDTLFISDTGNNRIIGVDRQGGTPITFASNLNQPTKLLFWPEARSIIFINFGDDTVRALNVDTGKITTLFSVSEDVTSEEIGGIFRDGRSLYISASYSIGVFNEIWLVRLSEPDPVKNVEAISQKRLSHFRETEHLNWPSDILLREDTIKWEEYYTWNENLVYQVDTGQPQIAKLKKKKQKKDKKTENLGDDELRCFNIRQQGEDVWQNEWSIPLQANKKWYKTDFILKEEYQGDRVFFRLRAEKATKQSAWEKSNLFGAKKNKGAGFKILEVKKINPPSSKRINPLANGNFLVTLKFLISRKFNTQRAAVRTVKVQLCSKSWNHPKKITTERIYVLYKGGSSILAWRKSGKLPLHYAGKHRFQDEYGVKAKALVGRPKALAFSSDGSKMYISENNKFAVYDFDKKKLKFLAGHLMDNYVEGTGEEARFSDPVEMVISPHDKWLYFVDRNNHRIRKLNTKTGETKYITGAGGTNFSFKTLDTNGYQEGGPCDNEFDLGKKGCAYFNRPTGIAISPDGKTLYIAEGSNNRVRQVEIKTGETSLIAGSGEVGFKDGIGSNAQFNGPYSLDISADGKTLYVTDKYNHAVRAIDLATKNVTTLFGKGTIGLRDGSFSDAVLAIPEYLREENGILYWTEAGSNTIRAASLSTRKVWTVSGNTKAGHIDGPGSEAEWNNPKGLAFRGDKIYVADYMNDLIRTIKL